MLSHPHDNGYLVPRPTKVQASAFAHLSPAGQRTPSFRSQLLFSTQETFTKTETIPEKPAEDGLLPTPLKQMAFVVFMTLIPAPPAPLLTHSQDVWPPQHVQEAQQGVTDALHSDGDFRSGLSGAGAALAGVPCWWVKSSPREHRSHLLLLPALSVSPSSFHLGPEDAFGLDASLQLHAAVPPRQGPGEQARGVPGKICNLQASRASKV